MAYWQNGKIHTHSRLTDEMMRVFGAHIADRPSCAQCVVKGVNRYSDLSILDCWYYTRFTGKPDDDRGHTTVIPHSQKGMDILMSCEDMLTVESIDLNLAVRLESIILDVQKHHPDRVRFFSELNERGLEAAIIQCIPFTINIVLVQVIGIAGVVISTIISFLLVEIPWETHILFKHYFKSSEMAYYLSILQYGVGILAGTLLAWWLCALLPEYGILVMLLKGIIAFLTGNAIFILCWKNTSEFAELKTMLAKMISKK